jgi:ParB-like chromosome segregation protein Spo0J
MEHLKIEYLPIERLKPYDKNAKEHPQEQIDQIIASIREFGMNDPIGI